MGARGSVLELRLKLINRQIKPFVFRLSKIVSYLSDNAIQLRLSVLRDAVNKKAGLGIWVESFAPPLGCRSGEGLAHTILFRFAGVVGFAVDVGVVFNGLEVGDDFGGHSQVDRQAFFQNGCEAVGLAD